MRQTCIIPSAAMFENVACKSQGVANDQHEMPKHSTVPNFVHITLHTVFMYFVDIKRLTLFQ